MDGEESDRVVNLLLARGRWYPLATPVAEAIQQFTRGEGQAPTFGVFPHTVESTFWWGSGLREVHTTRQLLNLYFLGPASDHAVGAICCPDAGIPGGGVVDLDFAQAWGRLCVPPRAGVARVGR